MNSHSLPAIYLTKPTKMHCLNEDCNSLKSWGSELPQAALTALFTMDDTAGKVAGIRQIVRLKQLLQKWQQHKSLPTTDASNQGAGVGGGRGIPPAVNKRLKAVMESCDSDDESSYSPAAPPDVPKGCVPVYVGPEQRRFVVPMAYLSSPAFTVLLEKAEEEFGFDNKGALTFPCEIETFKYILQVMEQHHKGLIDDEGNVTDVEE